MRFSTSLALLVGTTLVSASSSPGGGASPELIARATHPEHNLSERDLLERAASEHKFIRANRRRGHGSEGGSRNGPRRMEAREHGKQPAVAARAVEAEKGQLQKKDDLPLLVDAELLGKPLAVVDGTVNLGNEGLKNILGGLNLGGLLGKRTEEKKEKTVVTVDADVLDKNLADVDAKVDLTALNGQGLKKLLDADINIDLSKRTEDKHTATPLININADLLSKSLADVQAAINLNKLAKVNVDATVAAPAAAPSKATSPAAGEALVDADVKVDALNAHEPLAVVDAKIDVNTEKLAKIADADLQLNLLHSRSDESDDTLEKKATLPIVVDADLLGNRLADVEGAVKLNLENLHNILDADLDVKVLHKRHESEPSEQTIVVDAAPLDHPVVDAKVKLSEHLHNLKVGGLTLATIKKRTDQLAVAVNEHLTGDHASEDCGLGDVEDALAGLFIGVDASVFRRKL